MSDSNDSDNDSNLKSVILEFIGKLRGFENELDEIKEARKELIAEYSDRLDVKAIKAALQIVRIRDAVIDQIALDTAVEAIDGRMGGYLENSSEND